jgi:5'-3' exonuclease
MNFILIDGSYYLFYRFHALQIWWKNAHPNDDIGSPIDNEIFTTAFRKAFVNKLNEIPKKLKIKQSIKFVGKDCPRGEIWRNKIYPEYKGTRTDTFEGGPFFKMAYDENLFGQADFNTILEEDTLEADDCIAITTKHILKTYPNAQVYIITGDMDYLQLADERVHLYNLKFTKLTDSKTCFKDPVKDLMCKILAGDKSDNIAPIFKGCGAKTAEKLFNDPLALAKKLESPEIRKVFDLNTTLVDFEKIPDNLVTSFKEKCLKL